MKITVPTWFKENKKLRTALVLSAALLFMTLLLILTVVAPVSRDLTRRETQYADLRKKHADAVLFLKQKKAFAGVREGIPTQTDMPIMVKELVQRARRYRLQVGPVRYDIPKQSARRLTMLLFPFSAEGGYKSIKRFIHRVETSDRLIGIQELRLNAERGRVTLKMKLVTYIKDL